MNIELINIGLFLINLSLFFWIGNAIPLLKLSKQISEKFIIKRYKLIIQGWMIFLLAFVLTFAGIVNIVDGLTSMPRSEEFINTFRNSILIHIAYFFIISIPIFLVLRYFWRTAKMEQIDFVPDADIGRIGVKYVKEYLRSKYLVILVIPLIIFSIFAFLLNGCSFRCCMGTCEV